MQLPWSDLKRQIWNDVAGIISETANVELVWWNSTVHTKPNVANVVAMSAVSIHIWNARSEMVNLDSKIISEMPHPKWQTWAAESHLKCHIWNGKPGCQNHLCNDQGWIFFQRKSFFEVLIWYISKRFSSLWNSGNMPRRGFWVGPEMELLPSQK